ncbi:hypothetical protein vBBceHLY2_00133 [Bacillus phage vB_BceH_LY2]|nr:hypothetical protein vBBceHLY2_00133 [Bacillus phage vB_BceH_LY2]
MMNTYELNAEVNVTFTTGDSYTGKVVDHALAYARTMSTKLKRTYDINEQVFVYTC